MTDTSEHRVLKMPPSKKTPEVVLDPENDLFLIKGKCLPEDAEEFFKPVMEWADEYIQTPLDSTTLELELYYMNTSSSKAIYQFIQKMKKLNPKEDAEETYNFKVCWKYDDDDMEECGRDFERVTRMHFEFYPFGEMQ